MLFLKIILSILGLIFLMDVVFNLFGAGNAGGLTNALCKPFFGALYPRIGMFTGLLLWIVEIAIIVSAIWIWIA